MNEEEHRQGKDSEVAGVGKAKATMTTEAGRLEGEQEEE